MKNWKEEDVKMELKTYIIHLDKLKDRKKTLNTKLKNYPFLNVKWIIQKGYYTENYLDKFYEYNPKKWAKRSLIANRLIIPYELVKSQKHIIANHHIVKEKIAKGEEPFALVLEDDVEFINNFGENIKKVLEELKNQKWDICFLSSHPEVLEKGDKNSKLKIIDREEKGGCWANAGFIIKKEACKKLINFPHKYTMPNDEEFKYRCKRLGLNVKWVIPPLIEQTGDSNESGQSKRDEKFNARVRSFFVKNLNLSIMRKIFQSYKKKKLNQILKNGQ